MIAVPNKEQIKYTSATIQESNVYNKLKLFFELRRDDESPFTVEEILNCYFVCRSGKSFAARPGDMIVVLSALPNAKKAQAMLRDSFLSFRVWHLKGKSLTKNSNGNITL